MVLRIGSDTILNVWIVVRGLVDIHSEDIIQDVYDTCRCIVIGWSITDVHSGT